MQFGTKSAFVTEYAIFGSFRSCGTPGLHVSYNWSYLVISSLPVAVNALDIITV